MTTYIIRIESIGKDGECVSSTVKQEGESKQDAKERYLDSVVDSDYWDINVVNIQEDKYG